MQHKIFTESFYKDAVNQYQEAVTEAQNAMSSGLYKKESLIAQLNQAQTSIQNTLDKGYQDLKDQLERFKRETISIAEQKSSDSQQAGGTSELLRREDLKAKLHNMEQPDLIAYIEDLTQSDVIPEYDFYLIKSVAEKFVNDPHYQGTSLPQAVRELEQKLPANVVKASDKYKGFESELAETVAIPRTMLWINGTPHDVKADFADLIKDYH